MWELAELGEYEDRGVRICSSSFVFAAELDTSLALSIVPHGRRKIKMMVLVQDENEVQEVLPATLAIESGEGYDVEESSHQELKSTLERLPVKPLKLLCNGEGLSKVGVKRDLVERLASRVVSKSKRKERIDDDDQGNNVWRKNDVATLEKAVGEIKRSVQVMQNSEKSRYWPREKFGKARNQFEYDKWCKVERILDNALVNRNWVMIGKVHDVAATRSFMLRVAKKEGWNVAAGIRDPLNDDPMDVFFQEKLASARQLARRNERYAIEPDGALVHASIGMRITGGLSNGSVERRRLGVGQSSVLFRSGPLGFDTHSGVQSQGGINFAGMGISTLVADVSWGPKGGAQGKEANWPWDPFPIEALEKYHNNPPERVDPVIWCRDLAWMLKSDPFANGKFVPVESTGRAFTVHSLRIGKATAAIRGGMSLTQIRTIGGWDSKAVILYLKAVEMTKDKASMRMGF
ncbi:hypothetical protein C2G38_2220390 [Gigaspora rosea]|uniref:SAP domain-containing protein n=1 Tax=Gigaspora rosea TaxID=44941 RepID=A0A397U4Q3_9GLOM|nr:hypothetical protein C2G38_2220390 [Gigaspora rosea]